MNMYAIVIRQMIPRNRSCSENFHSYIISHADFGAFEAPSLSLSSIRNRKKKEKEIIFSAPAFTVILLIFGWT